MGIYQSLEGVGIEMGGKKSRRKPPPKKNVNKKLSTRFNCPFCNHEKSVDVKINQKEHTAILRCNKCAEMYETQSNYLSEPIDIFAEWLDEIAAANEQQKEQVVDAEDESV